MGSGLPKGDSRLYSRRERRSMVASEEDKGIGLVRAGGSPESHLSTQGGFPIRELLFF